LSLGGLRRNQRSDDPLINDVAANRLSTAFAPRRINWGEFGHFDNYGSAAGAHEGALDSLNAELPAGASLYYVTAYYDGVADGIYQHAGLLRPDIRIQYAKSLEELDQSPTTRGSSFPRDQQAS